MSEKAQVSKQEGTAHIQTYSSHGLPRRALPSPKAATLQTSRVNCLTSPQCIPHHVSLSPRRPPRYYFPNTVTTYITYSSYRSPTLRHTTLNARTPSPNAHPHPTKSPSIVVAMSILFLACLLAICLPILSVQLPRLLPHFQPTRSIKATENRPTLHQRSPPLRRRLRPGRSAPASRSRTQLGRRKATDGADSGARSSEGEEMESEEVHRQPTGIGSEGLLRMEGMGKGKGRADGRVAGRKPWDPPFPGTGRRSMRSERFGVPLTPPKKTGRELEASGVAIRLFPPDGDGQYTCNEELKDEILESDREETPWPTHTSAAAAQDLTYDVVPEPSSQKKRSKRKPSAMSALWICIAMLAFLLFILAFAILVAHCLAWFLVYKTEARLGEARRGIMQGGEMRLCLCAA
jgi:hypothetical protein